MQIILSGYGAMGRVVEQLAIENGHSIVGVFSTQPIAHCVYPVFSNSNTLPIADVIIDFSHPNNVEILLDNAAIHQLPMVVATTGDNDKLHKKMLQAAQHIPLFFSANMSYGIHVLTQLLHYITPLLNGYDIEIIERHHNQKIDAPSGTAIALLQAIQENRNDLFPVYDRHKTSHKRQHNEVGMSVVRGGSIVGDHDILFAGVDEVIEITHRAQSKRIFADGALRAGEQLIHKPAGFYTFHTL